MTKLEISIDGKKESYHLPQKWDEVSIKQYQELMVIAEDEELKKLEIKVRSISILTGCDVGKITKAPMSHLNKVYDKLAILTSDMPNKTLRNVIEIEGQEYGFIPDMKDLTFGEFVDIDTWMQDGYRNLVDILSVLYRPVVKRKGDRYKIEEYKTSGRAERADIFARSMSIDSVYGAMVFFYTIGEKLIETTRLSLEMQKKKKDSMELTERSMTARAL
mgnify:CR=1 FL=1